MNDKIQVTVLFFVYACLASFFVGGLTVALFVRWKCKKALAKTLEDLQKEHPPKLTVVKKIQLTQPTIDVDFYEWYASLKADPVIQSWERETRLVKGCMMHGFQAGRRTLLMVTDREKVDHAFEIKLFGENQS